MDKEQKPLITVLMAVYNSESWLAESIPSVLQQTFKNFEFIIVNDGSDDGSLKIINQFEKKDSRIRAYNKPNSGLADSLNYGIAKARGEWIARIDADDICNVERLQKQIERARLNTNLVLIGSGLVIIDENGKKGKVHHYPDRHIRLMRSLSRGSPFFAHSSAFFKLAAVRELRGYRTQFHRSQDLDLWLRLAELGEITCIKEPLVLIRKHDEQMSRDRTGRRQLIYSHMAMSSYYLRLMGIADPMESSVDAEVSNFRTFISEKLEDERFFEYQQLVDELKSRMSEVDGRFSKLKVVLRSIFVRPDLLFRYLKFRLAGSGLSSKFAREWTNSTAIGVKK